MKKICNAANPTIKWAFVIIFGMLCVGTVFFSTEHRYSTPLTIVVTIIIFCIVTALALFVKKYSTEAHLLRYQYIVLAVGLLLVFAVQSFVSFSTFQTLDHDIGKVFNGADFFLHDQTQEDYYQYVRYFNVWPNNVPIFLFFVGLMSALDFFGLGGYTAYYTAAIVVAQLAFSAAILFTFLYLRRVFGIFTAYLGLLFWLILPIVYLQGSVFYTDTYSLPFVPAVLYLYERASVSQSRRGFALFTFLTSITLFVGVQMKSTVLFVFIAAVIVGLLSRKLKKNLVLIAVSLVVFLSLGGVLTHIEYNTVLSEELIEQHRMPTTFWIAMGVGSYNGVYSQHDDDAMMSLGTQEEKKSLAATLIKERLSSRSLTEHIEFYARKLNRTFGSANGDVGYMLSRGALNPDNFIYQLILPDGRFYVAFSHLNQGVYVFLCIFGVLGAVFSIKKGDRRADVIYLALLGFFLFMFLWESNHRQLINQFPLYIMLASIGFVQILPMITAGLSRLPFLRRRG